MSKEVATPKQTAGGGFAFEDKVVGYYLVWMLAGTQPFSNIAGNIIKIDCQVAVDGWNGFDDLLLTLNHNGTQYHHAFSVKSNIQFSKDSAPTSFVRAAWLLFLHKNLLVMNIENDRLGMICVPHPEPPKVAIQNIIRMARQQTPEQLSTRLSHSGYTSDIERNIHNSFKCPGDLAEGLNEKQIFAGNILKKIAVIELDFENAESSAEATALFICAELIKDSTPITAKNLWNSLCKIAEQIRTTGGGISRKELLAEVRSIVELRELPDFADDWRKLDSWRDMELSAISDQIGGKVSICRNDFIADEINTLQNASFITVIGASGTGKTVVAKQIAKHFQNTGNVLWFKGNRMRNGYIEEFGSHHMLQHSLQDILYHGKYKQGLIILDSAEKLINETDFSEFCLLLHALGMSKKEKTWHILLTCRDEAWERVQNQLIQSFGHPMRWQLIKLDLPDSKTLVPVWKEFPSLRALAKRPHLFQIMRNFKVLDFLALAINSENNPENDSHLSETGLINWYWNNIIMHGEDGIRRDRLLKKLAAENADRGTFEISETELSSDDFAVI